MESSLFWDLTDLYKGITDKKIEKDLKSQFYKSELFQKKYKDKLATINSDRLLPVISDYEKILQELAKPLIFAHLIFSTSSNNPKVGAFLQKIKTRYLEIYSNLLFFEIELLKLPTKRLETFTKDKKLKNYWHYLSLLLLQKTHRLSETEEKIFNDLSLTGSSAFVRLFDEELVKQEFILNGKKLTESEVLALFFNEKRSVRKSAANSLTRALTPTLPRNTFITNTLIQDKLIKDRYFKFKTPDESRHLANETTQGAVNNLTVTVTQNYSVVQDYYNLKKKVLGLRSLNAYDIYAPILTSNSKIPYKKAKEIIICAFSQFSPKFASIAKMFFENRWIDVEIKSGKRAGAFCEYVTPDLHPYILINYSGNMRDVLTIAHELGHGINAFLAKNNSYLNYDWPLIIAETSSVFCELLVFDYLKNNLPSKETKSLYFNKIEDIMATTFRQISMFLFEKDLHFKYKEKGELTHQEIGELWNKRRSEMFGNSVNINSKYNSWWSYIPHFKHTPFYVYAYAYGQLISLSLFNKYKKGRKNFTEKYIDFLKNCGNLTPQELLAPFDINLEGKLVWQEGIDYVKELVREAKNTR